MLKMCDPLYDFKQMIKASEAKEQQTVVEYCTTRNIPIFAIPNGGKRNAKEAYFMKLSGVKAGVPDLCIPVPCGRFHGLFIEMKVGKNKLTANQNQWLKLLTYYGYKAVVCYGFEEARKTIDEYIQKTEKWQGVYKNGR